MSLTLLQRVSGLLSASPSLLTGYAVRYFRWTDGQDDGVPIVLFRKTGAGQSDITQQESDVTVYLIDDADKVVASDAVMQSILRRVRDTDNVTGAVRFDPMGTVQGPFQMEDGRVIWQLVVRVTTEDQ